MKSKTFYISLIVLFVLFAIQHILIKQPELIKRVVTRAEFTDVEIELMGGGIEPLGYFKDNQQTVLLIFWSANSIPAELTLKNISRRASKWSSDYNVEIITVNINDSEKTAKQSLKNWEIELKTALDHDKKISGQFGVNRVPTVILIGLDGKITKRWEESDGDLNYSIRRAIEREIDYDKDNNENQEIDSIIENSDDVIIIEDDE